MVDFLASPDKKASSSHPTQYHHKDSRPDSCSRPVRPQVPYGSSDPSPHTSPQALHEQYPHEYTEYRSPIPMDTPHESPFPRGGRERDERRIIREKDNRFYSECTFQPKINQFVQSGDGIRDSYDVWTRLELDAAKKRQNQKVTKERIEHDEAQKELDQCTFHPKIRTKKSTRRRKSKTRPVHERLHNLATSQIRARELKRRELDEQEVAAHSFAPNIRPSTQTHKSIIRRKPKQSRVVNRRENVYDRLAKAQKTKTENLNKRQRAAEKAQKHSFRPKLCSGSKRIIKSRQRYDSGLTVGERLNMKAQKDMARDIRKAEEVALKSDHNCTFKPRINHSSKEIIKQSYLFNGINSDFVERQQTIQLIQSERVRAKEVEHNRRCSSQISAMPRKFFKTQGIATAPMKQTRIGMKDCLIRTLRQNASRWKC